jgi:hypothetical protein
METSSHVSGIMIHLWIRWAEIAVDTEQLSLVAKSARTPTNLVPHLGTEVAQGMVSVCASVFALEAMTRALKPLVISDEMSKAWIRNETSSAKVTEEILDHSIRGSRGRELGQAWREWIQRRHQAVHFDGTFRPSVPYDGLNLAVEDANYTAEAATGAVDLLIETLAVITTQPTPKASEWANGFAGQLTLLRERRAR